jgi:hypothetical protein
MANAEHLQRLKRDVSAWNAWRKEHPKEAIDLSRASIGNGGQRRSEERNLAERHSTKRRACYDDDHD